MDVPSLFRQAVGLQQSGKPAEAASIYRRILRLEPGNPPAHQLLALALIAGGRDGEALEAIRAALALTPDSPEALNTEATILIRQGRLTQAQTALDRAIALKPDYAEAFFNRGNCLGALGRLDRAVADYAKAISLHPAYEPALTNRGNALKKLGRFEEALNDYREAARLSPEDPVTHYHLGAALHDLGRDDEALAAFDRALAGAPGLAAIWNDRAASLRALGRFHDALESLDRALELDCGLAAAWNNRGLVLRDLLRPAEALANFARALELHPDDVDALFNRASLQWSEYGRHGEAVADLAKAVGHAPAYPYARGNLLHLRMYGGDWQGFEKEKALIDQGVRRGQKIIEPFAYQAISDSPADLLQAAKIHAGQYCHCASAKKARPAHERIKLGYLSGEFRAQATQYLAAGLYERHDRGRFEIVAFDNGESDKSAMRQRLEAAFDSFIPIGGLSDREAAARIAGEEIDILVNLNGYFGKARTGVFALRPAPIQVNYLGFPGTLGAPCMDYILADRIVIPDQERRHFTEQVVWLPHSYQVNDDRRVVAGPPPSRAASGLPEEGFVFANFNQSYKLTPEMFARWMRILKETPASVLWLMEGNPAFASNLRREAQRQGVSGERLIFAKSKPLDAHLARLGLADLVLDTLPYNAHTTASDALWAGVPLLTGRGRAFAGRVAASLLTAIGLPELIAEDLDGYQALALKLAREPALLSSFRRRLEVNRPGSPLFDTDGFRRDIEKAYRQMWEIAQRGEAPRHFAL